MWLLRDWLIMLKVLILIVLIWLAWLKFKPVHALYLYIGDLIKNDWSQFKGFGFWLFAGLGGSGKTLSMVEYLLRQKTRYPRLKIYSNFYLDFADGQFDSWEQILNYENYDLYLVSKDEYSKLDEYNRYSRNGRFYKKKHNGIIFAFDEIHLTFASQKWENAPDNMLEYISQQRKLHKQIVASSQVFTRVDKKLREQTNFVIECKSIMWGRWIFNRYFNTPEYISNDEKMDSGNRRRKRAKRYSFIGTNSLRSHYNTYQVMINLKTGKSEQQLFADRVATALKDSLGG